MGERTGPAGESPEVSEVSGERQAAGEAGELAPSGEEVALVVRRFQAFRRFVVVCSECQAEMSADWHYCTDCGTRLATECPSCQQPLPPFGARFCPHCGLLIPQVAARPSSAETAARRGDS